MIDQIRILLFEDNDLDAELLNDMLAEVAAAERAHSSALTPQSLPIPPFRLERARHLLEGLERLAEGNIDLVLLDLCLPDSRGLDTFTRVRAQAPKVPLIVLTSNDDESLAIKTMQQGAQDYLLKTRVDSHLLARAMRYAVERKRAEETIRRAKEEAERASNAKGQFLSRMSHELRTPLNAILGFAQVLESDAKITDRESVDQILKAGRHLLDLINEVLEFSRLEAGRLEITLAPVAVGPVIREVLDLIRPLAASKNVRLVGDDAANCNHSVHGNRQRLKQALLNLLANAIKYNRSGGEVTISCDPSLRPREAGRSVPAEPSPAMLRISIADTGIGIASDKLPKLFVPFERIGAEDSEIEGTGLGLAVSKALIEAMAGIIGVESDHGRGSIFWVELPSAETLPEDGIPIRSGASRSQTEIFHNHKTVLYVEDNLSNLRLIERVLAKRPAIKLLSAIRGGAGIALAREHQPHLILLDLNLPDMNGAEVLRCLRDHSGTSSIPVVIISADATAAQIERLLAAGARNYLTKPIDVKQFLVTVDEILHEHRSMIQGRAA